MPTHRVSRGRESQVWLAEWYAEHGWAGAQSRAASLPGIDVPGMPGWAPEMKATKEQTFTGMLSQARKNADGSTYFVVYRPKGYGKERINQWLTVFDLETSTKLMKIVEGWK